MLKKYFIHVLLDMCKRAHLVGNVTTHALAYLQRHFLFHSIADYPPNGLVLLCIVLGCKACEMSISIDELARSIGLSTVEQDFVRANELIFLGGIKFHVNIHSPFRALRGHIFELRSSPVVAGATIDWTSLHIRAEALLLAVLPTDASFLYAPSRLALAALRRAANETNCKSSMEEHIGALCSRAQVSSLLVDLLAIDKIMATAQTPPSAESLEVRSGDDTVQRR